MVQAMMAMVNFCDNSLRKKNEGWCGLWEIVRQVESAFLYYKSFRGFWKIALSLAYQMCWIEGAHDVMSLDAKWCLILAHSWIIIQSWIICKSGGVFGFEVCFFFWKKELSCFAIHWEWFDFFFLILRSSLWFSTIIFLLCCRCWSTCRSWYKSTHS